MSEPEQIQEALAAKAQQASSRPIYVYDVPLRIAQETGITSVGMIVLSGEEYEMCLVRTRGNQMRLGQELSKQSLVRVNGRPVSTADASVDQAWERLGPMGRDLVASAYGSLHNAEASEVTAFMKSRKVVVG